MHFGVRDGRIAEEGATLFRLMSNREQVSATLTAISEDWAELDLPAHVPEGLAVRIGPHKVTLTKHEGKHRVPARVLWTLQRPDFPLVGYSLSTEGWKDPVAFLKEHRAHSLPAPFLPIKKRR